MRWRSGSTDTPPPLEDDNEGAAEHNNSVSPAASTAVALPTTATVSQDEDEEDESKQSLASVEDMEDGSDHAEEWKPQTQQSTCEFTHTILNYSQKREQGCKKAEYSATTVDEFGNRWRLIIYVNGNGRASNHHLSLFLQVADADDLPFGWKKAVSYVLTLEHPSGPNLGYAKRNPDKMFKLCPKAIDWGWSQFITSDKIQQEGYISNDSLTVRASVTVKSSSVSIDPEDAELYLKCAVEEGKPDAVRTCLAQGASVNCQFKDDLYTPLHTACSSSNGSLEVLNLLVEKGADGNACNKWRETPLLIAANNGHRKAVQALLQSGADPSLCSEAGWSALTFAAHKGYDDIVALLLQAEAPVNCRVTEDLSTPLHKACAGSKPGHLSAVAQLLSGEADVHALNKWRETPLLTAANHGQADAVDLLLRAGADPCKCTDTGWSPLSIAAYKGHDDVVSLLLEEGAPTEEEDPTLSALLQAATKGLPDTVELLLRHGADHTVTTKKGDTALSILVEQNLIDAAVDMVTEYKASIPRCSRDRKKVQRARLLINLRLKQQKELGISTDDETDQDESDDSRTALHENGSPQSAGTPVSGKKKKTKKRLTNASAEEQARAAEEALLLELEQEDAKAQKEADIASSKRAKKKKRRERERQQKAREEQRERERLELEEKQRERELEKKRELEQQERQRKEQEERNRLEKEAVEFLEQRKKLQKQQESSSKQSSPRATAKPLPQPSPKTAKKQQQQSSPKSASKQKQPSPKVVSKQKQPTPKKLKSPKARSPKESGSTPNSAEKSVSSTEGNHRGWEITNPPSVPALLARKNPQAPLEDTILPRNAPSFTLSKREPSEDSSFRSDGFDAPAVAQSSLSSDASGSLTVPSAYEDSRQDNKVTVQNLVELPAVALYREEKLTELFQRCASARMPATGPTNSLSAVEDTTVKTAVYRWIVRNAHGNLPCHDSVIPSWTDFDMLAAFFQRQFISESRKGRITSNGLVSMEALKEAGSAVAILCRQLAQDLVQFRENLEGQIPDDWSDSLVPVSASEVVTNSGSMVVIEWANRAQVFIPTATYAKLRDRHTGPPTRLLTTLFAAKKRYDSLRMIVAGTPMDFRLLPLTKSVLQRDAAVSVELWTDPFSSLGTNSFCGMFTDVDVMFGGELPFGKEDGGGEMSLRTRGGSVSAVAPWDYMIASRYLQRMVDLLELGDSDGIPLSFALFLPCECFRDLSRPLSVNDLPLLDRRLAEQHGTYVRFLEVLLPGQHAYQHGDGEGLPEICQTESMFVLLQNKQGKASFGMTDEMILNIIRSMTLLPDTTPPPMVSTPISFPDSIGPPGEPAIGLEEASFTPPSLAANLGAIGGMGMAISTSLGADNPGGSKNNSSRRRRGRFFDLIDDNGEDEANQDNIDVMSGMLSSLDIFQTQDVDIEAISLMGIGGSMTSPTNGNGNEFERGFG